MSDDEELALDDFEEQSFHDRSNVVMEDEEFYSDYEEAPNESPTASSGSPPRHHQQRHVPMTPITEEQRSFQSLAAGQNPAQRTPHRDRSAVSRRNLADDFSQLYLEEDEKPVEQDESAQFSTVMRAQERFDAVSRECAERLGMVLSDKRSDALKKSVRFDSAQNLAREPDSYREDRDDVFNHNHEEVLENKENNEFELYRPVTPENERRQRRIREMLDRLRNDKRRPQSFLSKERKQMENRLERVKASAESLQRTISAASITTPKRQGQSVQLLSRSNSNLATPPRGRPTPAGPKPSPNANTLMEPLTKTDTILDPSTRFNGMPRNNENGNPTNFNAPPHLHEAAHPNPPTKRVQPRQSVESTDSTQPPPTRRSSSDEEWDGKRQRPPSSIDSTLQRPASTVSQLNQTLSQVEVEATSRQLAFGFVDVKADKVMDLTIVNNSTEDMDVTLEVRYPTGYKGGEVFRIVAISTTLLRAHGGRATVSVHFRPLAMRSYAGALQLRRTNLSEVTLAFPLFGYGGRCALETIRHSGERLLPGRAGLRLITIDSRKPSFRFGVKNTGLRTAFCAVVPVNESGEELHHVEVKPQRVVVPSSQVTGFTVHMTADNSMQRCPTAASLRSNASTQSQINESVLRLLVFYGEERQRQRVKQYLQKIGRRTYVCHGVDLFSEPFVGESPLSTVQVFESDLGAFRNCVRMFKINVGDIRRVLPAPISASQASYTADLPSLTAADDDTLVQRTMAPLNASTTQTTPHALSQFSPLVDQTVVPVGQRRR